MEIDQNTLESFAEALKKQGKQPATRESYCRDAKRFLAFLATNKLKPHLVQPETLLAYRDYLVGEAKEKENSIRRSIIGVRQFYRFLTDSQILGATPFDEVPLPERDETMPDGDSYEVIDTILSKEMGQCDGFIPHRNAVILALLAYEGLKATEVIALKWSDFLPGTVRASLRIQGTRNRTIILQPETTNALAAYKRLYDDFAKHPVIAQAPEKHLLISFRGRDASVPIPHMTRHGLKFIIYELGQRHNVHHLNTETLRHFATKSLIAQGLAPEDIMQHLGLRRLGNIAKHLNRDHGRTAQP